MSNSPSSSSGPSTQSQVGIVIVMLTSFIAGGIGGAIGTTVGGQKAAEAAAVYLKTTDPCSKEALEARNQASNITFATKANERQLEIQKITVEACIKKGGWPGIVSGNVTCTPGLTGVTAK